ncbi:MAG TPA: alpha/beta fold hydrolase [Pyrinomonadaceae bacterium]|nr:alpha/beta fold hydrolase [Pyrinomonadaceae bacterium]
MKIRTVTIILAALSIVAVSATFRTQAQVANNNFTAREVTFAGAGGLPLHGTLILPAAVKGKVPAVLLLPGSGPSDRNGNQPPQLVTNLLKQIAERLAADGYASLRFDKRAAHVNAASFPKDVSAFDDFFSWDNFVGDARAGLDFLKAQAEINPRQTVLAGHSEGAIIAMQVVHDLEGKPNAPAALILLSSPGRPLGVITMDQVYASLKRSNVTGEAAKPYEDYLPRAIDQVIRQATVPPNPPKGLAPLFSPGALKLLQVEFAFDPAKVLPSYSGPVLVIQGEKDIQISPVKDFPLLQAALKQRKHGTYKALVVLSASHNLKHVENENAEAGFVGPVVPQVLDTISDWLKQTLKR